MDDHANKMAAAIEHLKTELKSIRTGRANPAMLDGVSVEVYGSQMRVKDLASITAPEPRMLLVVPFDQSTTASIGKAIERANIGLIPIVDGNMVRIKISPMDDSMRKDMVKLCQKRCEEAKISIRNIRRECNDAVRELKNHGKIAEDVLKTMEKKIQEQTDKHCKEADDLAEKKKKEISTI